MKRLSWIALGLGIVVIVGCGGSGGGAVAVNAPVATIAGSGTRGVADGVGVAASFNNPVNVALDGAGNVFVADFDNNRIRKITAGGVVSTLPAPAIFEKPFGIVMGPDGNLYVETDGNSGGGRDANTGTVWRVNPNTGASTVVAENIGRPRGLTVAPNGQLLLSDLTHHRLRLMNITTGAITELAGQDGVASFADGTGTAARFSRPYGSAVNIDGNILVADQDNHRIRQITMAGVVTTFAGDGTAGYRDGAKAQARFNRPQDVAIDNAGNVYVSDNENHRIRRIAPDGTVTTVAGDGVRGFADGAGLNARFFGQEGIAVTPDGRTLFVADGDGGDGQAFHRVRRIGL